MTPRGRNASAYLILLLTIALIGILDMPANFWAGDPSIWREETRSILAHRTLAVDPAVIPISGEPGQTLIKNPRNGLFYSKYGLMNALMSLPPMWLDRVMHGPAAPLEEPSIVLCNLWNIALSLLLAAVLMRITSLYTDRIATRIIFVLAIFYGTFLWYYVRAQSSEIYQTLFFTTAFFMLVMYLRDWRAWRLHIVWTFVAMLVLTRVLYLLLIPLIIAFIVIVAMRRGDSLRRLWPQLLLPPIAIVLLLGWGNFVKFGSPVLTGYHIWRPADHLPTGRIRDGLWGLLFLPRFSVFLYFPPLIFAAFMMRDFYRRFRIDALVALGTGIVFILAISKIPTWAGEWTFGPRYVLFALPILSLPFILFIDYVIEHRQLIPAIAASIAIFYSGFLVFRVNELDFFAYYRIRQPIETTWNDSVAGYFRDHHVGTVTNDLLHYRDNPDALPWFSDMKSIWSERMIAAQRENVRRICGEGNHYWFQDRKGSP